MSDFFSEGTELGALGTLGGAVLGWAVAVARNSTHIAAIERRVGIVEHKMDRLLESEALSDKQTAAALASINTTLTSVAGVLNKLDTRLDQLESRVSYQEVRK